MRDHKQYIRHSQSIRQFKIGALIIVIATYGVDYYWRDKAGYLFTSAPYYVSHAHTKSVIDVRFGVMKNGKRILKPPRWYQRLWMKGWNHGT